MAQRDADRRPCTGIKQIWEEDENVATILAYLQDEEIFDPFYLLC